jgi:EAL domain-containing protein (putative c-di-GMP-specific phosphodiesterase class I)
MVGPGLSSGATPTTQATKTVGQREQELRLRHRTRIQAVVNAGDGIRIVFQPVVDLRDGTCVGHEALARFADGRPPNEWFTAAHDVGIGIELEMAATARAVTEFGTTDGYLSINLSPATLTSAAFREFLTGRVDPSRLVLEVTEHAVVDDYEDVRSAFAVIRGLGARIAVDDAGSGISSMRHILKLEPEIIKLDRSLIAAIDSDPARRALARSLAQFATGIGADLVAEGVEHSAEMTACYESGIRFGQGYLLGRPGPIADTVALPLDR